MNNETELTREEKIERAVVLYVKGASLRSAAAEYGLTHPVLLRWMKRRGIDRRSRQKQINKKQLDNIIERYYKGGESLRSISEEEQINRATLSKVLRRAGKMVYSPRYSRRRQRERNDAIFRDRIIEQLEKGVPIHTIAKSLKTGLLRIRRVRDQWQEQLAENLRRPHSSLL